MILNLKDNEGQTMENILNFIGESFEIILIVAICIITTAAVIRSVIKVRKGKKIDITPVGVYNDLPESVTGLKKHKDSLKH